MTGAAQRSQVAYANDKKLVCACLNVKRLSSLCYAPNATEPREYLKLWGGKHPPDKMRPLK
jgi:hypothetical protein